MKTYNKTLFILIVFLELCFCVLPIFAADNKDVLVEEFPSFVSRNENGYDVYNYRLENLTSKNQTVYIEVYIDNDSYSDLEISKQVELVGNESRTEKVFFPVRFSNYSGSIRFIVNGRVVESFKLSKKYGGRDKPILLDKGITANDTDKLFKDTGLDWSERNNYSINYFESNLDMMDKDWIAYYQYAAVIFREQTFKDMPSAVQEALMDYVKVGGTLIILGKIQTLTDFWGGRSESIRSRSSSGVDNIYSVGLGRLIFCAKDLFENIKSTPQSSSSYGYGSRSRTEKKSEEKEVTKGIYVPKDVLREFNLQKYNRNNDLKVEDCFGDEYKAMTSVGLLIILVFVFAILLGPVNFYFLNEYKKRILIFVSVPLIALVCCSVIFLYFLIFEFGRLDIFRQSFVMLDEESNTAAVLGGELIISGKALNSPLSFPINSIVQTSRRGFGRHESRSLVKRIKLDKTQNLTSNWIKAKEPFYYSFVTLKQDRSRVEVSSSGSEYEILNGLGADISVIYYRDSSGNVYKGKDVRAGNRAKIAKMSGIYRTKASSIDLFSIFKNYKKNAESAEYFISHLRTGEYIALLKSDPFLKQDLDWRADVREMGCFVYGRTKQGGVR